MLKIRKLFGSSDKEHGNQGQTNRTPIDFHEIFVEIRHAHETIGLRPIPYTVPERLDEFLRNLEPTVEEIIEKGNPDRYNPRFFEETIDNEVQLALKELERQFYKHNSIIQDIRTKQTGALDSLQMQVARCEQHLAELEQEEAV